MLGYDIGQINDPPIDQNSLFDQDEVIRDDVNDTIRRVLSYKSYEGPKSKHYPSKSEGGLYSDRFNVDFRSCGCPW